MRDIVVSNNKHLSIISLGELRKHQADGFVVMRTLFLEYKRLEEKNLLSLEELRLLFQRWGRIESVQTNYENAQTLDHKPNAYITFFQSHAAYEAFMYVQQTQDFPFYLLPADGWHQPQRHQTEMGMDICVMHHATSNASDSSPLPLMQAVEEMEEVSGIEGMIHSDKQVYLSGGDRSSSGHYDDNPTTGQGSGFPRNAVEENEPRVVRACASLAPPPPKKRFKYVNDGASTSSAVVPATPMLIVPYNNPPSIQIDCNRSPVLNEHCLLHIMSFCDLKTLMTLSDASTRFRELAHKACYKFERHEIHVSESASNPSELVDPLHCIGTIIKHLTISCPRRPPFPMQRLYQKVSQNVGEQMGSLFLSTCWLTASDAHYLQPLLHNITSLKLSYYNIGGELATLQNYCPQLKHLDINGDLEFNDILPWWPSLESVHLEYDNRNQFLQFVRCVCTNNPQLKGINIYADFMHVLEGLKDIVKFCPALERIRYNVTNDLDENIPSLDDDIMLLLQQLKALRSFSIHITYSHFQFFDTLPYLVDLNTITHLQLEFERDPDDGVPPPDVYLLSALAKELPYLSDVKLIGFNVPRLDLCRFLKEAKSLRMLTIEDCIFNGKKKATMSYRRARFFGVRGIRPQLPMTMRIVFTDEDADLNSLFVMNM